MPIKAVVSDINSVDEGLRSHYVESNGQYVLNVEAVQVTDSTGKVSEYALENVTGIKNALQSERAISRAANDKIRSFEGLDSEKVRSDLNELSTLRSQSGDVEARVNTLAQSKIEQLVEKHQVEMSASVDNAKAYRSKVESLMVDQALATAIRKNGGNEGTVTMLMPHLKGQVSLREMADGNLIPEVVDQVSKQPRIGDSIGTPMSMDQLVGEFKGSDTFAAAFPGTGTTGGGTQTSNNGGSGFPSKKSDFSAAQRSDYIEKNGATGWVDLAD